MAYVAKVNGYIIDVPNLIYKPNKGVRTVFNNLTNATVANGAENLPINGGQGKFPLAIIPTNKTQEFQFECADFDTRLFAATNDTQAETITFDKIVYGDFKVGAAGAVALGVKVADLTSIEIEGLEKADAAAEGKFTAATAGEETTVTLHAADFPEGTQITISYVEQVQDSTAVIVKTTNDTGNGEFWLDYPVYAGAEKGSGIQGRMIFHVFSAYVTALPGLNNSYKSASTFGASFQALDPKRPDGKMYEVVYVPTVK